MQIQVLSVSEDTEEICIQIEAPNIVAVQCRDVDSEVNDRKLSPVITHKRRWRSSLTK
ncbi:hypothetical protein [Pseudomonas tremae]|uniref:hypothetical protein n=1 Tax=Pseudomonas tremae TaxID=200454 RepID=UPI00067F0A60|nr:hypothetical protein [Pseudomonas tremae]